MAATHVARRSRIAAASSTQERLVRIPSLEQCALLVRQTGDIARRHEARTHRFANLRRLRANPFLRIELDALRRLGEARERGFLGVAVGAALLDDPLHVRSLIAEFACGRGTSATMTTPTSSKPATQRPRGRRALVPADEPEAHERPASAMAISTSQFHACPKVMAWWFEIMVKITGSVKYVLCTLRCLPASAYFASGSRPSCFARTSSRWPGMMICATFRHDRAEDRAEVDERAAPAEYLRERPGPQAQRKPDREREPRVAIFQRRAAKAFVHREPGHEACEPNADGAAV